MNRSLAFIFSISFFFFSTHSISVRDFKPVYGSWQGTITYKDYTTGKPFTMPANITVYPDPADKYRVILVHTYPNEPKANGKDTLLFSRDGQQLDGETLVSRIKKEKGTLEIISERTGVDGNDNKKAVIRHVYSINKKKFIIRKEVKFDGTSEYIMRNEYSMSR
jgi:hypothetical protein